MAEWTRPTRAPSPPCEPNGCPTDLRRRDAAPVPRADRPVAPQSDGADQHGRAVRLVVRTRRVLVDRQRPAARRSGGLSSGLGTRRPAPAEARGVRRGAPPPGGSHPARPFEGNRFRVGRLVTGTCSRGPAEAGRRSRPRVRRREDEVRRCLDRCARRPARARVPGSEATAGDVERSEAAADKRKRVRKPKPGERGRRSRRGRSRRSGARPRRSRPPLQIRSWCPSPRRCPSVAWPRWRPPRRARRPRRPPPIPSTRTPRRTRLPSRCSSASPRATGSPTTRPRSESGRGPRGPGPDRGPQEAGRRTPAAARRAAGGIDRRPGR